MHFEEDYIYHIYNRSNEKTFFNRENYLFFLRKVNKLIKPNCEILSWCLMPNHFHFLIQATDKSVKYINERYRMQTQLLSKKIGTLLSSYSSAINNYLGRRGSLWAHNTTAKLINSGSENYGLICFNYIHQNPVMAKLVPNMEDWEFSSYVDYTAKRNGKLVNKKLAFDLFNYDKDNFEEQSKIFLEEKILKEIL